MASLHLPVPLPAVQQVVRELFLSGAGPKRLGQPRVVACVTGGGGPFWAFLLSEPGASTCLLEGVVPYDKHSCLEFLAGSGRGADGIGFCSAEMAQLLAESARDRALSLTPQLVHWPDCVGVACTATIVSHYKRRGDYRAHASAVDAGGAGSTYSHKLLKGARDRPGEDAACALLALRALADATARSSASKLAELGLLLEPLGPGGLFNVLGEEAPAGAAEEVPLRVSATPSRFVSGATVLVPIPGDPGSTVSVAAPSSLPANTLVVLLPCAGPGQAAAAAATAARVLSALGLEGDGKEDKSWGQPQAAVLFGGGESAGAALVVRALGEVLISTGEATAEGQQLVVKNWGVAVLPAVNTATPVRAPTAESEVAVLGHYMVPTSRAAPSQHPCNAQQWPPYRTVANNCTVTHTTSRASLALYPLLSSCGGGWRCVIPAGTVPCSDVRATAIGGSDSGVGCRG